MYLVLSQMLWVLWDGPVSQEYCPPCVLPAQGPLNAWSSLAGGCVSQVLPWSPGSPVTPVLTAAPGPSLRASAAPGPCGQGCCSPLSEPRDQSRLLGLRNLFVTKQPPMPQEEPRGLELGQSGSGGRGRVNWGSQQRLWSGGSCVLLAGSWLGEEKGAESRGAGRHPPSGQGRSLRESHFLELEAMAA